MKFRLDDDVRRGIVEGYTPRWKPYSPAGHGEPLRGYEPYLTRDSSEPEELIKEDIGQFMDRFLIVPLRTMVLRTNEDGRTADHLQYQAALWLILLYNPFPHYEFMRKRELKPQDLRSPHKLGYDREAISSAKLAGRVTEEFRGLPTDPLDFLSFFAGSVEEDDPETLMRQALFVQPLDFTQLNDPAYLAYRDQALHEWEEHAIRVTGGPEGTGRVIRDLKRKWREANPDQERHLHLDAVDTWHHAMELGFREVYRRCRKELTRPERRLFQLPYFRHPRWYPFLLGLNEGLVASFLELDPTLERRIFQRLILRMPPDSPQADEEILRYWKAFLKVYAWAIEAMTLTRQEEETLRAERKAHQRGRRVSAEEPLPGFKDLTYRDVIEDADVESRPDQQTFQKLMRSFHKGALPPLIREYCVEDAKYLLPELEDNPPTQEELARHLGVSHQAVSKGRARAIQRLMAGFKREGLRRDDLL